MGKQPVRMKAVIYALSPFQQKVMPGLWKDFPNKIAHKVSDSWMGATLLLGPLVGTYSILQYGAGIIFALMGWYVQWYQEKEKMEHRY